MRGPRALPWQMVMLTDGHAINGHDEILVVSIETLHFGFVILNFSA